MTRSPESLMRQARTFLVNIGAASSGPLIFSIDPLFKKFMVEECGVNEETLNDMATLAGILSSNLKHHDGIVTKENCAKFLSENP